MDDLQTELKRIEDEMTEALVYRLEDSEMFRVESKSTITTIVEGEEVTNIAWTADVEADSIEQARTKVKNTFIENAKHRFS